MPVDVDGLDDLFRELDDLEDDFTGPTEDWIVPNSKVFKWVPVYVHVWHGQMKMAK